MTKKIYQKLIRDKIPEIIARDGRRPRLKRLGAEDFEKELKRKIFEEAKELIAGSEEEIISELADIQEAIDTLLRLKGFSREKFKKVQNQKRKKRGGFKKRLYLFEVCGRIKK